MQASEVSGVKVMRFESSLYFGNVERFRSALVTIAGQDPTMQQSTRQEIKLVGKGDADDNEALLENEHSEQMGSNEKSANGVRNLKKPNYVKDEKKACTDESV